MAKKSKSTVANRIIEGLQEFADALIAGEPIAEKFTVRTVELNLPSNVYDPRRVKETRELFGVSQAIFAKFLGVSVRTVHSWEQGVNAPSELACRFMDEIRRDPKPFISHLHEAMVSKNASRAG